MGEFKRMYVRQQAQNHTSRSPMCSDKAGSGEPNWVAVCIVVFAAGLLAGVAAAPFVHPLF